MGGGRAAIIKKFEIQEGRFLANAAKDSIFDAGNTFFDAWLMKSVLNRTQLR